MYVNDFDNNGKSEFIINWYAPLDTTAYPFALKPELTSQLPGLRKKILKFGDYARQKWDSLYTEDINKQSLSFEVKTLQSSVLWNDLNSYRLEALPVEAQVSPVFGIATDDTDADGRKDILLAGNFYALKPQVGRQNSNRGIVLRGTKDNKFETYPRSGFAVNGEVREILPINTRGRRGFLVGRNNDSVLLFLRR
jgi:enediyne biosynthesis protein E4